jgi:hypothetical protein
MTIRVESMSESLGVRWKGVPETLINVTSPLKKLCRPAWVDEIVFGRYGPRLKSGDRTF